jgi:hypothetical protein
MIPRQEAFEDWGRVTCVGLLKKYSANICRSPRDEKKAPSHSVRKTTAQCEGRSKNGGKVEQFEAALRACRGHEVIERPRAARFIAAPRCWTSGVRVRVQKALL